MKLKTKHFLLAGALALPLFFTACSDNQYAEPMPDNVENIIRPNNNSAEKVYTFMPESSKMP